MKKKIYIVHTAQFYENSGELITFAKAFPTLEKAAKFIVKDYNTMATQNDAEDTALPKDEWKSIAKHQGIESPGEDQWDGWVKWEITASTIEV